MAYPGWYIAGIGLLVLIWWQQESSLVHSILEAREYGSSGGTLVCHPDSPKVPWQLHDEEIEKTFRSEVDGAGKSLRHELLGLLSRSDAAVDALSVAVVDAHASANTLWSIGFGRVKGNESANGRERPVDDKTVFRIGSISKLFTTLQTLILVQRDDPLQNRQETHCARQGFTLDSEVRRYLPKLRHAGRQERITARMLASHQSGLGKDHPRLNQGADPAPRPRPFAGHLSSFFTWPTRDPVPTKDDIYDDMQERNLVFPPWAGPSYSNTGFNVLGWLNEAVDLEQRSCFDPHARALEHAQLVERDITRPLNLSSSIFKAGEAADPSQVAVPSGLDASYVDLDFTDSHNPAGGQFSSADDLGALLKLLLKIRGQAPDLPSEWSDLTSLVREWFRPTSLSLDGYTRTGMLWEIFRLPLANTQARNGARVEATRSSTWYTKSGYLPAMHSLIGCGDQEYGFIVLKTGKGSAADTPLQIGQNIVTHFEPIFRKRRSRYLRRYFAGSYKAINDTGQVIVSLIDNEVLALKLSGLSLVDQVNDVAPHGQVHMSRSGPYEPDLRLLYPSSFSSRVEFRMTKPRDLSKLCSDWFGFDVTYANGWPVDLVRFGQDDEPLTASWIEFPASGEKLYRTP